MEYTTLGRSGVQVSRLCLGMMSYGSPQWQKWILPSDAGQHFVKRALDCGINFFDTADFYSYGESETILGNAIADSGCRHDAVICTKVGLPMRQGPNGAGLSRKLFRSRVEQSLRRLRTDYIDIYMLHQPDADTPLEETVDAIDGLIREGKILYAGASNYPAWGFAKLAYMSRYRHGRSWSVAQIQYNLCYREDERDVLPLCLDEGLGVMVYSPLARGWLAGNRAQTEAVMTPTEALRAETDAKAHSLYGNEVDREVQSRLFELARNRGIPAARLAMSWILSRPGVSSIICGVLEDGHLDEAIAALNVKLSDDELRHLQEAYRPQPLKDIALNAVKRSGESGRE